MKKAFRSILAGVLALTVCIGFAACGTDAKSVKGEKVTEEEWDAAIEALTDENAEFTVQAYAEGSASYKHETMVHSEEYTAKLTSSYTYVKKGSLESKIGYQKISYKGDKIAAEEEVGKAGKTEEELYSALVSDTVYIYEKGRDGEWKKSEGSRGVVTAEVALYTYLLGNYGSFEYSTEHKGYIPKSYEDGDDSITVIKFKEAKLVAIYTYLEEVEETSRAQEYTLVSNKLAMHLLIEYSAKDVELPRAELLDIS